MWWVVHCLDVPNAHERRVAARARHSARLKEARVKPVLYGPLTACDGETVVGSMIVVDAETHEEVTRFFADDPFMTEGVWQEVRVYGLLVSKNSPIQLPAM